MKLSLPCYAILCLVFLSHSQRYIFIYYSHRFVLRAPKNALNKQNPDPILLLPNIMRFTRHSTSLGLRVVLLFLCCLLFLGNFYKNTTQSLIIGAMLLEK